MLKEGVDPIIIMSRIAANNIECSTCRGRKRTMYLLSEGHHAKDCAAQMHQECTCDGIGERICQSCFGTGLEKVSPQLRYQAASELAKYKHPQFKQIEDREANNEPRQAIEIVLVRAPARAISPPPAATLEQRIAHIDDSQVIDAEVEDTP